MFTRFPELFQIQRNFLRKTSLAAGMKGRPPSFSFLNSDDEEVESFIEKKGYPLISRNIFDYKAWQAGEELKPFKVGDLIISPPWEEGRIEGGEVLVHLDPCVVFGIGYHPTTRTCLKALWEIYQKERSKKSFGPWNMLRDPCPGCCKMGS